MASLNDLALNPYPSYWRTMEVGDLGISLKLIERVLATPISFLKSFDDALAADTTSDYFFVVPSDGYLLSPKLIPLDVLTADNTNYATIRVASAGTLTEFTTQITGSGDWVAGTPIDFPAFADDKHKVTKDDKIRLRIVKAGTGVVVPRCVMTMWYAPRMAV
jgi:hypothetical protein